MDIKTIKIELNGLTDQQLNNLYYLLMDFHEYDQAMYVEWYINNR